MTKILHRTSCMASPAPRQARSRLLLGNLLPLIIFSFGSVASAADATPADPARFAHRTVSESVGHAKVADMDRDGHADVVVHIHRDDWHIKTPNRQTGLAYCRWPDFEQVVIFNGPISGERFVVADIDGDGYNDVVTTQMLNPTGHTKDGNMGAYWIQNPGKTGEKGQLWKDNFIGKHAGQAKDVAVGDIDGDGRLDIAVRGMEATSLFFQKPDGWKFKEIAHQIREGIALADLDKDGDLDVVLNGFWMETPADPVNGDYVRHDIDAKWFNQNTGGMDNGAFVVVGDINRDGLLDIVISHPETVGYPLSWYSVDRVDQVKTGPWKEHVIAPVFDWCETVDVGDIDNDGDLDVLAAKFSRHTPPPHRYANSGPFPVSVFYNVKGDGSEWQREDVGQDGIYGGAFGDVGSDGDIDIVGPTSYWKGPIHLWENQTSDRRLALEKWTHVLIDDARAKWGDFAPPKFLRYFGIAFTDVNGDGMKDIFAGRYFYRNPGGDMTGKWERADFGDNLDACLSVDVDGDEFADGIAMKLPDILWLEATDHTGTSWTQRKIGTVPPTRHVNSQGFATGQIVPGGKPELVFATEDGVYYFEIPADPNAGEWPRHLITKDASDEGIDLADIDRDGWVDLVAAKGEEYLAWWKNPGASGEWKRFTIGSTAPNPIDRIRARDINGDGRLDIVVTEERYPGKEPDGNVYWFEQPADPTSLYWPRHRVYTGYSVNNLDVADFDRDGDQDIVTAEHKGPDLKLLLFENDGRGKFTERVLDQGRESHLGTQAADLDGDGDLDLVSIGWDQSRFLHLWRNDALKR